MEMLYRPGHAPALLPSGYAHDEKHDRKHDGPKIMMLAVLWNFIVIVIVIYLTFKF